jgi:hypothetical protein
VEEVAGVLARDVILEVTFLVILFAAIFAFVLSLAVHALHMAVEGVFVLEELIANFADVAFGVLVLSHVACGGNLMKIINWGL